MDTEEGFVKLIYSKDELKSMKLWFYELSFKLLFHPTSLFVDLPFSIDEVDHYLQQLGSCGLEKLSMHFFINIDNVKVVR